MTSLRPITCPGCGAARSIEVFHRTAGEFCAACDYPLFWSPEARRLARQVTTGSGLDRLAPSDLAVDPSARPGGGIAIIDCPVCAEPNPWAAEHCLRCDAELRPAAPPPIEPEPQPEPVVAPELAPSPWWARIDVPLVAGLIMLQVMLAVLVVAARA